MKSFTLLLIAFLGFTAALQAQSITGKALQSDGKPADFATVVLHKAIDSTVVTGAVTGEDGAYEIKGAAADKYFVRLTLMGSGTTDSPEFQYDGKNLKLEPLQLSERSQDLKQVTVIARRPPIEVKADKTILNVEGTVNSTGLSALELLRKADRKSVV